MPGRSVLVIHQDEQWCARLCRFLEGHGITAVAAASVNDAAQRLQQMEEPAAVVFDIAARQDGRAVTALRDTPGYRTVPVGYVKTSAPLDALLLMLLSSTDSRHRAA